MRLRHLLILTALLAGCGSSDSLQGSLSDEVSLSFSSVTVTIEPDTNLISVAYLQSFPGETGDDTIFEIVVDTTGLDLSHGGTIDLTQLLADMMPRGSVTRAVHDDARNQFPPFVLANLEFNAAPTAGAHVSGSFHIQFGQGGELGGGRTVFGNFAATVIAAEN